MLCMNSSDYLNEDIIQCFKSITSEILKVPDVL